MFVPTSNDNQENYNGFLLAAQIYGENGWSVIPLQASGKEPALGIWVPYQKSAATETTINQWWENGPDRNIGIVQGKYRDLLS